MSALSFSRSKLVSVERNSEHILKAHGVLDDYIYSMEMDVAVSIQDYKIVSIDGKMNRITTGECHKALAVLQNAIGMDITDREFARTVNRVIGRAGCLHLGALLVECCDSILQAAIFSDLEKSGFKHIELNASQYATERMAKTPGLKNSCLAYSTD
jgi:hypothetical protein